MKTQSRFYILLTAVYVLLASCSTESGLSATKPAPVDTLASNVPSATVILTAADRSVEFKSSRQELKTGVFSSTASCISMDTTVHYQTMDGFGAAITGSSCYNLLRMSQANRTRFLQRTFSASSGMGYSYVRVAIGCSDFSLSEYTCCDNAGIQNFGLTYEEINLIIPVLKEILAIQPGLKIMAAPWTAPRWMKVSQPGGNVPYNSWTAGHVATTYYQDYATYFVKWIQAFQLQGIPIYAVTPQNEPLNGGNSASTLMTQDEELAFIRDALGPAFKQAGLSTRIYSYDHNYDVASYPLALYKDSKAAAFIEGAAFHNYAGDRSVLSEVHRQYPGKGLLFTEASIGEWCDGRNMNARLIDDMNDIGLGTVNNWCTGSIVWNLMLNSEKGPNRNGGCQSCYGAVDISSSDYATITENSHYYVIGHMAAVVKPGAIRIGLTNGVAITGVTDAAFRNPDGSYALVVCNSSTSAQQLIVSDGTRYFYLSCPPRSVASCIWKKQ